MSNFELELTEIHVSCGRTYTNPCTFVGVYREKKHTHTDQHGLTELLEIDAYKTKQTIK
jgi:hypothetical protein